MSSVEFDTVWLVSTRKIVSAARRQPNAGQPHRRLKRRLSATIMQMADHEAGNMPEAWRRTELARHPDRPYPMDFIEALFTDFSEIHGDRAFGDDPAMACGMARFHGRAVMVVANLKGRTLKDRVARKFGSPDPEGYRKALRAMQIAEKFGHPIFTFMDLAGANPETRRSDVRTS